jgi:hypothetical protein
LMTPRAVSIAKVGTVGKSTAATSHDACAMGVTIVGTASVDLK